MRLPLSYIRPTLPELILGPGPRRPAAPAPPRHLRWSAGSSIIGHFITTRIEDGQCCILFLLNLKSSASLAAKGKFGNLCRLPKFSSKVCVKARF